MYPGTLYPGGKTNHPWKNPVLGATPVYSWFLTTRSSALSLRQRHRPLRDGHSRRHWDHTHEVLRQDYDLDYTTGWDGDFNEHTYVPPDTLVADMRHGERPDGGGGRDND